MSIQIYQTFVSAHDITVVPEHSDTSKRKPPRKVRIGYGGIIVDPHAKEVTSNFQDLHQLKRIPRSQKDKRDELITAQIEAVTRALKELPDEINIAVGFDDMGFLASRHGGDIDRIQDPEERSAKIDKITDKFDQIAALKACNAHRKNPERFTDWLKDIESDPSKKDPRRQTALIQIYEQVTRMNNVFGFMVEQGSEPEIRIAKEFAIMAAEEGLSIGMPHDRRKNTSLEPAKAKGRRSAIVTEAVRKSIQENLTPEAAADLIRQMP